MLQVIRALELPAEEDLLPNTIYLTPEYSKDGSLDHRLAITVTGTNAQVFRSSLESWEVANMIANAVVAINKGPNGNDGLDQLKAAVPVLATRLDDKDQEIANINGVILGGTGVAAAHTRIDVLRGDLDTASAATNAAAGTLATRVTTAEADIGALETGLAATNATVAANAAAATTYTNTKHAEALAYANNAVAMAVGALDLSNSAVYAANIAARNALTLTKNTFVMVADATADATVDTGAALYFYNLATTSYVKVAEYESMDLFPNQAVLQGLSDVGGRLYYKGAAVATVHNTVNEW